MIIKFIKISMEKLQNNIIYIKNYLKSKYDVTTESSNSTTIDFNEQLCKITEEQIYNHQKSDSFEKNYKQLVLSLLK